MNYSDGIKCKAVSAVLAVWVLCNVLQAADASPNPRYNIDPDAIFPSPASVLPRGVTYTDTVPGTLDLAEQAKLFIQGASQENVPLENIWVPGGPAYFSPQNPVHASSCDGNKPPCIDHVEGFQNWGKLALGVFLAREMSGYDLNDANGTIAAQYRSVKTMLSWDTFITLRNFAIERPEHRLGGYNLVAGNRFMTPASVVMQALIARGRQDPGNRPLRDAINEYVRMDKEFLSPYTDSATTRFSLLHPSSDIKPQGRLDTFVGYNGEYRAFAFVNGRAAMSLWEWYDVSGDREAFDIAAKLTDFLRNFAPLWANPDPSRFSDDGQFEGHIHSYLQAAHAFTDEAAARLKASPSDPIAHRDIQLANNLYQFVKRRTQGAVLGNFGEMDSVDDMIRLGISLSELGAGPYWDEVERWTRNTVADRQIDPATAQRYIGNQSTGTYSTDHVADKVTGMWFSDATHSLAIPLRAWMYNIDDATNPMHAAYEIWAHTIEIQGNVAQINFALNRASEYLDVKSDLPYRGQIEVAMKSRIGPVRVIAVRIPGWADQDEVTVARSDMKGEHILASGTDWTWISKSYVRIADPKPNLSYVLRFPIKVYQSQFTDIRSADQFWYEGDYPSPNKNASENVQAFVGTFRGDMLVDATPRPTSGVPRYQRQSLARLPSTDVAPPTITVQRFVADP